jgi:hypothetical protein
MSRQQTGRWWTESVEEIGGEPHGNAAHLRAISLATTWITTGVVDILILVKGKLIHGRVIGTPDGPAASG